jgi:mannose-6-phosphate isomerase-like protein (cupin superfamily)
MIFVVDGILDIFEKDTITTLHTGEFYIVRRGIKHRVVPRGHVKLILFEPAEIVHTGKMKWGLPKRVLIGLN